MLISYIYTNNVVSQPTLAMGLEGMYHGENFEKMTQYGEFGCIYILT